MRLSVVKKYVEQLIANGGGGGGGFVPDWQNQVEIDPSTWVGPETVIPAGITGARLVRVVFGIVSLDNGSGATIILRHVKEGIESDITQHTIGGIFSGELAFTAVIGDGAGVLVKADVNGSVDDVPFLQPTRITEVPSL